MDTKQATEQVTINIQDIYTWRAYYGSTYLDESHAVSGFASVGPGCTSLVLLNQSNEAKYVVAIPDGASPVFFRRRTIAVNLVEESSTPQGTIHCVGWKRSEHDATYLFVHEDGSTLLSDNLQASLGYSL